MITSQRIFIYLFNVLIVCDCESVVGASASLPNPNQAAGCLNTDQKYWHPSPVSQRNCIFFPRLCTVFALSKLLCWRADYTLIVSLQRRTTQKKRERKRIWNEGGMRWYIVCSLQGADSGCLCCIRKLKCLVKCKQGVFLQKSRSCFITDGRCFDPSASEQPVPASAENKNEASRRNENITLKLKMSRPWSVWYFPQWPLWKDFSFSFCFLASWGTDVGCFVALSQYHLWLQFETPSLFQGSRR